VAAGLTAQAATFAREDVIAALGAVLVGAARAELDPGRPLSCRAGGERGRRPSARGAPLVHPELLGVEERLVAVVVGHAGERMGTVAPRAVREALAAHPSLGADLAR
jgi:hypothetical protein